MIRAEDITFRVGTFTLDRASLEVRRGEYFVLLGPPGSGKTLFLEALCGLRRVESGRILIDGRDVTRLEPRRRGLGYVPQDYALFPHRTVDGNIRFGLVSQGLPRDTCDRRVAEVADQLGIAHLLGRRIGGLSGGERQRVALGRALVIRPKVLLLDEPVSALDESTRDVVCSELRRLQRELNITTIHVSHHLQEAFSVADRAGILRDGRFQQIGTLPDLLQRPASVFVAGFMRSQNILTARVVGPASRDGWVTVEVGERRFELPGSHEGEIRIVVRPERIQLCSPAGLSSESPGPTQGEFVRLPALVHRVVDRGVYLRVELEGPFRLVAHVSHEAAAELALDAGKQVLAHIRAGSIHILATPQGR